ncbi:hypothetical protein B296_00038176 [Ensete ventricosum]|uniref:Uncharacterized protein n=1 Tax=Ensete ventricosum TaxID=4639 RepID=A0A426YFE7_ENSVE|nr:hypothetical protein B296_00038176 [Ensete ventricosum]
MASARARGANAVTDVGFKGRDPNPNGLRYDWRQRASRSQLKTPGEIGTGGAHLRDKNLFLVSGETDKAPRLRHPRLGLCRKPSPWSWIQACYVASVKTTSEQPPV